MARFPQNKYRFQIYDNIGRLSWQKIKAKTGCYALINLTYFNMTTFAADDTLMVDGKWVCPPPWHYNGLLVGKDGNLTVGPETEAKWGYANGEPAYRVGGVDDISAAHFGVNGSTFVGVEADGTVVLLLASKDKPISSRYGIAALSGCRDILRFDGSWSSQGSLGPGLDVDPSQERIVRSYLLVFKRNNEEEDIPLNGLTKHYLTKSDCYKSGKTIIPKKIMVHSLGIGQPDVNVFLRTWNVPGQTMCVHAFVHKDGTVQTLPWNWRGWHAGGSANNTHIGFEICEPEECNLLPVEWKPLSQGGKSNTIWAVKRLQQELQARGYDPKGTDGSFGPGCKAALISCQKALGLTADGSCGPATVAALAKREGSYLKYNVKNNEPYFRAVWNNAVSLCADLCKQYGLDPIKDIICHAEGYKLGIASNHSDITHWFPLHGENMDTFRTAVKAVINGGEVQPPVPNDPTDKPWYADDQKWVIENNISDGSKPEDNITRAEVWAMLRRATSKK